MRRIWFTIMTVLCALPLAPGAEPSNRAEQVVADVKQSPSISLSYHQNLGSVRLELPRETQVRIAELLTHLQYVPDYAKGARISYHFTKPPATIIYTSREGKERELVTWGIGIVGQEHPLHALALPREVARELHKLVSYETNKEAIHRAVVEKGREFMAAKAAELELIKSATDVRAELRCNIPGMERTDRIPLTPAAKKEILSILAGLQLVPAEKVVVQGIPGQNEYRYLILTCGDKTYELKMDDICTPTYLDKQTWQDRPYLLGDAARARLVALTPIPKKKKAR